MHRQPSTLCLSQLFSHSTPFPCFCSYAWTIPNYVHFPKFNTCCLIFQDCLPGVAPICPGFSSEHPHFLQPALSSVPSSESFSCFLFLLQKLLLPPVSGFCFAGPRTFSHSVDVAKTLLLISQPPRHDFVIFPTPGIVSDSLQSWENIRLGVCEWMNGWVHKR